MSYCRTHGISLLGVEGHQVTVEAHIGPGPSVFTLSGLPDLALSGARIRVRAAFNNSSLDFPDNNTIVNLIPATLPKTGSSLDLAIAVAVLGASNLAPCNDLSQTVFLGELGLDGSVRAIRGILPSLLKALESGAKTAIVSTSNAAEAALVTGLSIQPVERLIDVVSYLKGEQLPVYEPSRPDMDETITSADMADIVGQETARRAAEVAAAGGHHLFMLGPPGSGKTMLAERLPSILPELSDSLALETTAIYSIADHLPLSANRLVRRAPFSAPHHSTTMAAMVGGGTNPIRPGAVSLAHNGILFLDEAPEFKREVLDALRQPLESGHVLISRSQASCRFPARAQLVLAANPCPCAAGSTIACRCSPATRHRYLARLSGPLMDRIDIRVELPALVTSTLLCADQAESSIVIAERVTQARRAAAKRWMAIGKPWSVNCHVPGHFLRRGKFRLSRAATKPADWMVDTGLLTGRGYDSVLRLAWTLADLHGRSCPDVGDVSEATVLRLGANS